ncbi:MAG: amidohydrolase family protein [Candidatus Cloacimonetes bacterium]|nr:amidohydrolase family protein [Candidatus Cloacimonadota bacterium]
MTFDLIIKNGTLICMDEPRRVLEAHHLGILNGKIEAIFPAGSSSYEAKEELDADNCLVLPGLINAHSHLAMTYFRGLADDLPLDKWLQGFIWPLEARLIKPQFVYDATLHGASEMIRHGISTSNDMYFCMSSIADACSDAGLRVIISEALIDHQSNEEAGTELIGSKIAELSAEYRHNPLISFSLAPHSIYTCSSQTLQRCAEVATRHDWLLHMHLCETASEVENCHNAHGKNPVAYLRDLGLLEAKALFAHGIWLDDEELSLLQGRQNVSIAICTKSNLKLSSGFAPLKKYRDRGIKTCLGTDGVASNNNLDLLSELSLTSKLHKALNNEPTFLPAEEALAMITIDAAKALGKAQEIGSLEPGKLADIAIMSLAGIESQPCYNPYSHLLYAASSSAIRDMIIQGKVVMRARKLTQVDESRIVATAKQYQGRIIKELKQDEIAEK